MAQARQTIQTILPGNVYLVAAFAAALILTTVLTFGGLNIVGFGRPAVQHGQASPALVRAEREWVRQRLEQSGYVDPAVRSAQQWELQRRQQSGSGQ